jgi:GTPase involved in cell partitioning and DNA repair
VKAFEIIEGELGAFSETMPDKPMIVVATKLDATTDHSKLEELRAFCAKKDLEFHAISAPTGDGVKELVRAMADALDKIPKETLDDEDSAEAANEGRDDEEYDDAEAKDYEAADDSESDEPGPPIPKVS